MKPEQAPASTYDPVSKTLHWVVAFAILIMFLTAFAMGAPQDTFDPETRRAIFTTHKTTGFFILCLMMVRIIWGHYHPAPALPLERFPRWQRLAARFVHDALYVLALVTPFIGWVLVSMGPYGLKLFGVIEIPALPFLDELKGFQEFREFSGELHETLASVLVCLLIVHIGATFLHHFVDRDDILMRISPVRLHPWLNRLRGK